MFIYSKSTQRKFGHSKGTPRALQGHLCTRAVKWHLGTWALKVLGHLGTWGTRTLEGNLGFVSFKHSDTWGTWGTLFNRLILILVNTSYWYCCVIRTLYLSLFIVSCLFCVFFLKTKFFGFLWKFFLGTTVWDSMKLHHSTLLM